MYDTIPWAKATGPGSCRVTVAGDLDVCSAPTVRATLREALSRHGRVVVDCSRLSFIDCTGLSALLAAARAAKAEGAELRLCAVSHALARLLRLSHTAGAFTIELEPADRTRPDVVVADRDIGDPSQVLEPGMLRADAGIIEPGRDGMGLDHLAVSSCSR